MTECITQGKLALRNGSFVSEKLAIHDSKYEKICDLNMLQVAKGVLGMRIVLARHIKSYINEN